IDDFELGDLDPRLIEKNLLGVVELRAAEDHFDFAAPLCAAGRGAPQGWRGGVDRSYGQYRSDDQAAGNEPDGVWRGHLDSISRESFVRRAAGVSRLVGGSIHASDASRRSHVSLLADGYQQSDEARGLTPPARQEALIF